MNLVIDAYNILKNINSGKLISQSKRDEFIKLLNSYAIEKKLNILLVFDGFDVHGLATQRTTGKIKVIYAGKYSADEYIKNYVESNFVSNITVVSSDRSIKKFVLDQNLAVIDSLIFYKLLLEFQNSKKTTNNIKNQSNIVYKTTQDDTALELDNLMLEASENVNIKDTEIEVTNKKNKQSSKLTKEERKLLKILDKL